MAQSARIEAKFDNLETKFDTKFETLDKKFETKFYTLEEKFDAKYDDTTDKVYSVKEQTTILKTKFAIIGGLVVGLIAFIKELIPVLIDLIK